MSSFTTPLVVSPLPDGRRWKLVNSFTYRIGSDTSQEKIVIHNGFITDFASVPQFLYWFLPPWGKYGKAAVLHDYLYKHHSVKISETRYMAFNRRKADEIFLEAMGVLGVKNWRKYPMFVAVRLFGGLSWSKR